MSDHGNDRHALRRLYRTEHDVDRKFGAVLPFPDQVQACTHRPHPHFLVVALLVHDMGFVKAIRHQDFHGPGKSARPGDIQTVSPLER
jgi:hypothetical protein